MARKTPEYNDTHIGDVRSLWAAVIAQAIMDAGSESSKPELMYLRRKARCWLLGHSRDFVEVCENAGYDPHYVKNMALEAMDRRCQWRNDHRRNGPLPTFMLTPSEQRALKRKAFKKPKQMSDYDIHSLES